MFAKERQSEIEKMLRQNGAVSSAELVSFFGVSMETVRRDLLCLEEDGRLFRVHGGAVSPGSMKSFPALKERNLEQIDAKRALSEQACLLISEGDYIAVDSGSTAAIFAESLKRHFSRLTVATYSADVFEILRDHRDFTVILCGGHYLKDENAFCGPLALSTLRQLHLQKSFVFPSAVSLEGGLCDFQMDIFPLQQELLSRADSICVLADSSKFETHATLKLCDMKQEFSYVTDSGLAEALLNLYRDNQRQIYVGRKR